MDNTLPKNLKMSQNSENYVENILKHCRLCQNNLGTLVLTENRELMKQICDCINIKADDSTSRKLLPKSICCDCKTKVESVFSYVQLVRKVDRSLRHILKRAAKKSRIKLENNPVQEKILESNSRNIKFTENHDDLENNLCDSAGLQCTICSNLISAQVEEPLTNEKKCFSCKCENKPSTNQDTLQENSQSNLTLSEEATKEVKSEELPKLEGTIINNEINVIREHDANSEEKCEDSVKKKSRGFKCKICKKTFVYQSDLTKHKKSHKMNFTCQREDCGKICTSAYSLRTHEMRHEGKRPFLCVTCGKGFITKNSLNCHEKIHSEVKGYICNLCNIGFSVRSNLRAHEKKHHEGVRFYCSQCTRAFITKCSLERHELLHTGVKEYQCEICPSAFYTIKELLKHQRYHQGIRQHKCDQCFKTFYEKHHLTVHLRAHTGERPYICKLPGCGKSFTESQKLTRHLKARHPPAT